MIYMNKFLSNLLFYALLILLFIGCANKEKRTVTSVILFEEDNRDWMQGGDATWQFQDVEIIGIADSTGGFLMTNDKFKDFELILEFFPDSTINSGVFVRCSKQELSADECFEINIWDNHPNQNFRTGAIVKRTNPKVYVETIGKWNTYKIRCEENQVQAWVNDQLTAEIEGDQAEGYVGLQAAGSGTIKFRNVELRKL